MAAKKPVTPVIDAGTLAVDYGFALSTLNSDPDLKRIFAQAVAQTWTTDKFIAELRGTHWFQRTSDTARQWLILQGSDEQTYNQRLGARANTLATEAAQMGVTLSAAKAKSLANQSIMFGWTDAQVQQSIGTLFAYNAKTPSAGLAGQAVDKIRQAASDYLVPISDAAVGSWTQKILEGQATADDFTEYAKAQAKSMFPPLASSIDKGITVQQYADPYKQQAATVLGINPNEVDFTQDKWRSALDTVDPKTKDRAPMSLADWTTKLKTDSQYGYDTTSGARDQAASLTASLAKSFGFGA